MRITCAAHAKINWALNITGRRPDGYHTLDMVMQRIALADEMTFDPSEDIHLTVNGVEPADPEQNLVVRAARALNRHANTRHGARIALVKRIPARAGLGGGSADCAQTLKALNALWELGLSDDALREIGLSLGADVPFCLTGGLARVTGIGECLSPIPGAPSIPLVLVTPGGGLSTGQVFSLWDSGGYGPVALDAWALARAITARDLARLDALCRNALTAPAVQLMPEIAVLIDRLRALGAGAAFMTGSGSTVVGAFGNESAARRAAGALPGARVTRTLTASDISRHEPDWI